MKRKKCFLCGTTLNDGGAQDPHFKTARHARRERGFRRSFGAELARKLERLMKRWLRASPARRR